MKGHRKSKTVPVKNLLFSPGQRQRDHIYIIPNK